MMTTPRTEAGFESDSTLWQLVRQGSPSAFETLVRRHQSLVCAVAYSACGNLALSEDLAQETFWTAWRQRESLEQPEHLGSWLCGIARNLGKNARRKASRPAQVAVALDRVAELPTAEPGPAEEAVSREEESLVWKALARIPQVYREPLVLFYRENRSVAEVAGALALSEDAVRQRLSRGRGMLRRQVAGLVEEGLRRSRPGRRLTVAVMAGLTAHAAAPIAVAGVGAGAGAGVGVGIGKAAVAAGGWLGGVLGPLGGLFGGWLGTWVPAQLAPTRRERDTIWHAGQRMLLVSVLFLIVLGILIASFAGSSRYLIAWAAWFVVFQAYILVECIRLGRRVHRIRAEASPTDPPNDTALRAGYATVASRFQGRVFRSRAAFLGLPLIDIQLGDPRPTQGMKPDDPVDPDLGPGPAQGPGVARGWIAIGDDARGILLAIGSSARGFLALGGRAMGVFSLGGLAVGLVTFGGLGLGIVGVGGLGAGAYAFGGGAIGWRAAGGLAVAWDVACGGAAVAWHGAVGGAAIARDYAVGGEARARHANDDVARAVLLNHPFTRFALPALAGRQRIAPAAAGAPAVAAPARFRLENGLTAIIRPVQDTGEVALLVLYAIGGDHDPPGRSGLAHLVEHLYVTAAAGAEPARTSDAFFRRYRAGCNAQTGDRYTVFATVFPQADLDKELTEAAARMGGLDITPTDLDRERPRLLEELANMFGRIPALGAMNHAREQIRPTPRGGRKGGRPEEVSATTLDEVRAYWHRYYKPRNAILVLAGAVDEGAARRAIAAHFARLTAGEPVPAPGEPGPPRAGAMHELTVPALQPQLGPQACLAYAAPDPSSELYPPFLALAARLFSASGPPGDRSSRPAVAFPLLEDPVVLGVGAAAKPGETAAQAFVRLEEFVAEATAPPLRQDERGSVRQMFAFFLGTVELPDSAMAQNLYGVALSLARREQLAIDPARLNRALDALTETDLRRAAEALFAPSRHSTAFVTPGRSTPTNP